MRILFLSTLLVPGIALATLTAYESFNYPGSLGSSINTLNGGTGFSNAWTNTDADASLSSTNSSLSYPPSSPLTPQGAHLALTAADASTVAFRGLSSTMNLAANGLNFYSSALMSINSLGQAVSVQFSDGTNVRWNYGINAAGNFTVGVAFGNVGQTANSLFTATPNTTYLVVAYLRTNTGASGADQVFLSVFDPAETITAPSSDAGWDIAASGGSTITLNRASLNFNNAAGGALLFDEFRIGTTFLDVTGVIPEPGHALLCGLSGLAMLARRRWLR